MRVYNVNDDFRGVEKVVKNHVFSLFSKMAILAIWPFLAFLGSFLDPSFDPFFTILAYFLGDFWKVGYKKGVKKGSILAILVTFLTPLF